PPLKGEDVEREAVRLFGPEGRTAIGAAAAPGPTFDIDVSSFATNRRVLEYLEFFQVDSRDRFEIWLARLGRYQGMIRERLRAKRLPEDLLYLCLIESGIDRLPGEQDSVDDHTFFLLSDRRYLRRETRDYVPKLIAASLIAKQPDRYGFDVEPLSPLEFDEVTIPDATGLDVVAR